MEDSGDQLHFDPQRRKHVTLGLFASITVALLSLSIGLAPIMAARQPALTFAFAYLTEIDATGAPAKPDTAIVISPKRTALIEAARNVAVRGSAT
jgi:hypothetical protein